MGGSVGGCGVFPTRSKQIRMDQRGSRQIKGDQCDLWVRVRGVGGVAVGTDQGRSKITVV